MKNGMSVWYSNIIKILILLGELDIDNLLTDLYRNIVISDILKYSLVFKVIDAGIHLPNWNMIPLLTNCANFISSSAEWGS